MTDRYGYIGIETLLNYCQNSKDHSITPNDFMRMNRVRIEEPKQGEWIWKKDEDALRTYDLLCSECGYKTFTCENYDNVEQAKKVVDDRIREGKTLFPFCPNCGASMSANDEQVTGKLNSEIEYKAKVKELEDAIAKCERAEKEFTSRTCKFRSQINCDFCSFHSDCNEHWKEGEDEPNSKEEKIHLICPHCLKDMYYTKVTQMIELGGDENDQESDGE